MSDVRVSSVRIRSFRGIPHSLFLDLHPDKGDKPVSLIISGDNGVGKSSIVDAIEFALQGRIHRKRFLTGDPPPVVSLMNSTDSEVSVDLYADKVGSCKKNIIRNEYGEWHSSYVPHPSFSISPCVLRRSDILQFWNTPEHQRQLIFFDFLRDPVTESKTWAVAQSEEIEKIETQRIEVKNKRRQVAQQLAEHLKISVSDIPLDSKGFDAFVQQHVYGGLTRKRQKAIEWKTGRSPKVDQISHNFVEEIRAFGPEVARLNSELNKLKENPSVNQRPQKAALREVLKRAGDTVTILFSAHFDKPLFYQTNRDNRRQRNGDITLSSGAPCEWTFSPSAKRLQ